MKDANVSNFVRAESDVAIKKVYDAVVSWPKNAIRARLRMSGMQLDSHQLADGSFQGTPTSARHSSPAALLSVFRKYSS